MLADKSGVVVRRRGGPRIDALKLLVAGFGLRGDLDARRAGNATEVPSMKCNVPTLIRRYGAALKRAHPSRPNSNHDSPQKEPLIGVPEVRRLNGEVKGNKPMTAAHDETPAQSETTKFINAAGGVVGPDHTLDEQASHQDFEVTDATRRPVEDLHSLLLRISHHLDFETSERSTIYYRLRAIDDQTKTIISRTKRRRLRAFARYLVAICVGVGGTLAWQSYGETTKQVIATRAPDIGWSPESKQMIATWVQELGLTKPPGESETAAFQVIAPQAVPVAAIASNVPAASAVDPEQVREIALGLTAMRQSLDQIAAGQDQMAREIAKLQTANVQIPEKIPTPAPQPAVTGARRPISVSHSSPSRTPAPVR